MSDLQNLTPANTYKALLQLGDYTNGISGSTGANALQVSDGAGNNTSLALSTNRVGINNTSPSAELDVSGDVVAGEYALGQTGSSSSAVAIHAPTTNELAIRTNSAERVRIDSSGNVGIGTNPSAPLHVLTSGTDGTLVVESDDAGSDYAPDFLLFRSSTTPAVNDNLGEIKFRGKNDDDPQSNIDYTMIRSRIKDPTNNSEKGELTFWTRSGTTLYQRMTIDSAGNVGIGTTSPSAPLEVSSTTGGVIMPRMTTTQMNAISSPTDGEMIYNTTANKFYGRANGAWVALH